MKSIKTIFTLLILLLTSIGQVGADDFLEQEVLFEKEIEETFDEDSEPGSFEELSTNSKSNGGGTGIVSSLGRTTKQYFSVLTNTSKISREPHRTKVPSFILYCCLKVEC